MGLPQAEPESEADFGGDIGAGAAVVSGEALRLYVQHFNEKLQAEHGIQQSYTSVEAALQGGGIGATAQEAPWHRKWRPRRPLPEMMLHIESSEHRWFTMTAIMG